MSSTEDLRDFHKKLYNFRNITNENIGNFLRGLKTKKRGKPPSDNYKLSIFYTIKKKNGLTVTAKSLGLTGHKNTTFIDTNQLMTLLTFLINNFEMLDPANKNVPLAILMAVGEPNFHMNDIEKRKWISYVNPPPNAHPAQQILSILFHRHYQNKEINNLVLSRRRNFINKRLKLLFMQVFTMGKYPTHFGLQSYTKIDNAILVGHLMAFLNSPAPSPSLWLKQEIKQELNDQGQ